MLAVEFDHAIALRIVNMVGEDAGAGAEPGRFDEQRHEVVAAENVVAQDEADGTIGDKVAADEKRLGNAAGLRLGAVRERKTELTAVAEEFFDARQVARRADNEDVADAGQHEN